MALITITYFVSGARKEGLKIVYEDVRSLKNDDIEGAKAVSKYKARVSTYNNLDYSDVPKKAVSKLAMREGDAVHPSFEGIKPEGANVKPRTRVRAGQDKNDYMNVNGIDGATSKQIRKWKQRPKYDGTEAGPRKAAPATKVMVADQSRRTTAKGVIFSEDYYKNDGKQIKTDDALKL